MDHVYTSPPEVDALSLSALTNATHRKQVIYAGDFVRRVPGQPEVAFSVTPDVLDRWASDGNKMLSEGVACVMPLEHTNDPEKKRGEVVQWERGYDSKGRDALFAHFSFTDEEAAKKLSSTDVSVYVPEEYTNAATGHTYQRPIRHVAFTDQPVIPGLDKTETLVLSYSAPKEPDMKLREVAESLGLEVKEDATDEQIAAQIKTAWKAKGAPKKEDPTKPASKPDAKDKKTPLAAGFVSMATESRETKIDGLVKGGNITPAAAKELKDRYASKERVTLALSEDGTFSDGFDDVFAVMSKNTALNLSERSGDQRQTDLDNNPLVENAKKRADAARR